MKIVIGVNNFEHAVGLGEFAARLQFQDAEYHFVHVRLPLFISPVDFISGGLLNEIDAATEAELKEAEAKLEEATAKFREDHPPVSSKVLRGATVPELLGYSEKIGADLIVVGRREHKTLDSLMLGSVSRGLVVGAKTSVLVMRTPVENRRGPLGVVFAVDHSPYCNRCVEHFRELAPRGLAHLSVLNVFSELDMARLHWALPDQLRDIEKVVLDKIEAKTDALAAELKGLSPGLDARTEIGSVSTVIRETVEKSKSELLILGAQGHNWIERLSLGSVSFHQALEEPYSVLIVRVS